MSAISAINANNLSLMSLLLQEDDGGGVSSLLSQLPSSAVPPTSDQTAATSSADSGSSSTLQDQIQSSVATALQSAEESGNPDLKGVIYNTLVQTLQNNGIDPTTLQPTNSASGSQSTPVDSTTSSVLSEVLTALSQATAASDPLTQLTSSLDSTQGSNGLLSLLSPSQTTGSSGLLSLLSPSQSDSGPSDPLAQFPALEGDTQGSADLASLLSSSGGTSQNTGSLLSALQSSQNNSQNLLGFLYDSGQ
jgi:hypothetical protein